MFTHVICAYIHKLLARGGLRCWVCREDGHDLYNCPYLSWQVRMLFAKANYDYQAETLGPDVANTHFGMRGRTPRRGFSPRDRRNGWRRPQRNVTIASPPVTATHPAPKEQQTRYAGLQEPKAVLTARRTPATPKLKEKTPKSHDSSSTSSGN